MARGTGLGRNASTSVQKSMFLCKLRLYFFPYMERKRMNPWRDTTERIPKVEVVTVLCPRDICPDYPTCSKEERKCLNEIRTYGKDYHESSSVLENGLDAQSFSLAFLMKHHFRRKTKNSCTVIKDPIITSISK